MICYVSIGICFCYRRLFTIVPYYKLLSILERPSRITKQYWQTNK